ncbi:thiamine ABC transporter ATP-binding protein [Frigidibacter sp. ROC022]|uniref:thiamine ABC transporter ATP-binding protein n=1 Tax=Frigidibacter sp. ROC022 TaxID=2971796 RepID=UPI00215A9B94|nr:ATP-binding cassette domain-containing protein [Frigidibacter sp. ROC022]MCR8724757.1 ATP-binding cassette domain-containing protein [Frigidibacter sp. ROC022]
MLTLERLHLRQGDFTLDADLGVGAGARVAVLGPSGAGKSTLLMAIGGYLAPDSGRVLWDGQDITGLPPGDRPLTTLFQDINLFPHLTVFQNVALGISPRMRPTAEQSRRIGAALAEVGLAGLGQRLPRDLSGGQQSRVALARALLRARPLLLLDEPFSALGPALKTEMLGVLEEVLDRTRATLLMVTHDPADARAICPQTITVLDGVAAAPEDTAALLADPPAALRAYLGTP